MSFDLNITSLCNHQVFRELALIDTDRRTIRLEKPMGATSNLEIYATDNFISSDLYEIVQDPLEIDVNRDRVIYFKNKWRSPTDYFEISYTTLPSFCAKCAGSNYLDDPQLNVQGDLLIIRDEYLLMQNVEKFIITAINSNTFHPFIGTNLQGLIGTRISNVSFVISQITAEISRTLQKLQDLQSQYQQTGRAVTTGEMLATINDIQVTQDTNDPSILRANVSVTAQSGQTVEFTQILKLRV